MTEFEKKYKQVLNNAGGVSGTMDGIEFSSSVQDAVDHAIYKLQTESDRLKNVPIDYVKGNLAEQWHAETFNINAAARGRNDIWADVPGNNIAGRDIDFGDANFAYKAELKYYKTADETAKALSRPQYNYSNKIAPSDQIEEVINAADRLGKKNIVNRPDQAANYKHTVENTDKHLNLDNVDSKPLSEPVSKQLSKEMRRDGKVDSDKYNINTESFVKLTDIGRESLEAGMHAAVLSAVLASAPYVWEIAAKYVENGEVDIKTIEDGGLFTINNACHAGLRGAIAAAITSSMKSGLIGESAKNISPLAIGMATTMAINAIKHSIKHQQGKILSQELMHLCMRDAFILAGGYAGAVAGQAVIPVPMLGALIGNIIGSVMGSVLYDGSNQLVLIVCVDSGWTCFGVVKQDYTISEEILNSAGYDIFETQAFTTESFAGESFSPNSFPVNSLSFKPISRGVIGVNVVGYI